MILHVLTVRSGQKVQTQNRLLSSTLFAILSASFQADQMPGKFRAGPEYKNL